MDSSPVSSINPISTTLSPSVDVGTVVYYQDGQFGTGKGLLLALTNTPRFIKTLMTNNGLQRII